MLYSCKPLFEKIKAQVGAEIDRFPLEDPPTVCIITTGGDEPSARYVRNKLKDFAELGIVGETLKMSNSMQLMYFLANNAREYDGVIVQRPIDVLGGTPKEMAQRVAANMPPEVDIDGIAPGSEFIPPSVRGLDLLLHEWGYNPAGKSAVVIGRGEVGRPVAEYLIGRDATVTVCHSRTPEDVLEDAIQCSDICIGAADMDELLPVSGWPGTVVVDYGIKPGPDGKLHGNFAQSDMTNIDRSIRQTPVPGGMGLMVRAGLLLNIVDSYKRRRGLE